MNYRKPVEKTEDRSIPIQCVSLYEETDPFMRESNQTFNKYVLSDRESHGQRTRIRIAFECWARGRKYTQYKRLRQKHVVLSLPSSEQAELAMQLIAQVCKSLDGKLLAPVDSGTSPRG